MADKREITIQGETFKVSQPYAEGHQMTEAEARALNQTRAENIRNNIANRVKKAKDENDETTMEEVVAFAKEYDGKYDFTVASGGSSARALDPVEREARKIARKAISDNIKAQGKKVKDFDKDQITALVNKHAVENEQIVAEAKKRVKAAAGLEDIKIEIA